MVEKISSIEALKIAMYGFLTVFIMLFFLMLIIIVMSKIMTTLEKNKDIKKEVDLNKEDKRVYYKGDIKLKNVDEKTAACIMAIISENSNIPLNRLIFKEIEKL